MKYCKPLLKLIIIKTTLFALIPALLFLGCKKDLHSSNNQAPVGPTNDTTQTVATSTTLSFSGYAWTIKETGTGTAGPGPNSWKAANAYVDTNGYLHLKITKSGGKWYCAEVQSTQSFGYGKYQFFVDGRVDQLDKNVILGLFNYSGTDGIDEMDIEYGTFGGARPNSGFTVYPSAAVGGNQWHNGFTTTLSGMSTTQRFTRNGTSSVFFQELDGHYNDNSHVIDTITCHNPPNSISSVSMPVFMNLWLYQGTAPVSDTSTEIVIESFTFTPQ